MPLYEYQCRDCEREVELLVRNEHERLECPECGGSKLMKLLSVTASAHTGGAGPAASGPPSGGGCGGGCACHPRG
jgi:putative FmdB family regulatory protein